MTKKSARNPAIITPVKGQNVTATRDALSNFAAALGTNADNLLNQSTYSFNFITRNRILLEAMYRTSWVVGRIVDAVADDMTQAGIEIKGSMPPDEIEELHADMDDLGVWTSLNDTCKWARLYGNGMGIILIDGQDMTTPLRLETVGKGQFKGVLACDRWQFQPSSAKIREMGPNMGMPKFYTLYPDSILPNLGKIHHSRIIRLGALKLPHYQKQTENMWDESIIERIHDRLIAFDSTTVGTAQLVYKAYLRTWKIKDFRKLLGTASDQMQKAVLKNFEMVRRFQNNEGITMVDLEDDFQTHSYTFAGLDSVLLQFGHQLCGAAEIPMVRFFGEEPAGLGNNGESSLRTYYDGIRKKQNTELKGPVKLLVALTYQNRTGRPLPRGTTISFRPLWQLTEVEKADIASKDAESITKAYDTGLLTQKVGLEELRQSSQVSGRFSNISDEDIELADDKFPVPEMGGDDGDEGTGGNQPGESKLDEPEE